MGKYRPFICLVCGMFFHSSDRRRRHVARHRSKYSRQGKLSLRRSQRKLDRHANHAHSRKNRCRMAKVATTTVQDKNRVAHNIVKHLKKAPNDNQKDANGASYYNSLPHLQPLHHISTPMHAPHIRKTFPMINNAATNNPFNGLTARQMNGMIMPRFPPPFMLRGHGFPLGLGNFRNMGIGIPYQAMLNGYNQLPLNRDLKGNLPQFLPFPNRLQSPIINGPVPIKQGYPANVNGHSSFITESLDAPLDLSNKNDKSKYAPVDTFSVAESLTNELKRYGIPQAVFARVVLKRTQGTLSDLLRNPKPWSKLKSGRETFRRMQEWLEQPEHERMSALKFATQSEGMGNQIQFQGDEPLDLDVKSSKIMMPNTSKFVILQDHYYSKRAF